MSAPRLRFHLPPAGTLQPNNDHDPLPYYYHRWVGWLYRHRLQMGLDLVPDDAQRVLEIGVGSGVLVPTLTRRFREYVGTDLQLAPDLQRLVAPGSRASFVQADLLRPNPLPPHSFDAVLCFSVLEHIADCDAAARALAATVRPGGVLIAGYPMVSRAMTRAFALLGYPHIEEDHVSPPARIVAALARHFQPAGRRAFPPAAPVGLALYQCTRWRKAG